MHADRAVLTALVVLACASASAQACSISVGTPGGLRVDHYADPTTMASTVGTPTPATLTSILPLLSGVTFDIGVPTVVTSPGGYNPGTGTQQVAYNAAVLGLLQIKDQAYTSSPTSFSTGVLGAVTVTIVMHNKIVNTSGFPTGNYGTRTVVTCHP